MGKYFSESRVIVNSFSRIEDKYVLPQQLHNEFVTLVEDHLDRSYGSGEFDSMGNQSIYFDSNQLECFQQHFEKLDKRMKLRIRRYGINGIWDKSATFVERKFKINGISSKQRFLLSRVGYERITNGQEIEITPELIELNSTIKKESLIKRVNEINQMVGRLQARPKLIVEYKRMAFEKGDVRITVDKDLRIRALEELSREVLEEIKKREVWNQALQMEQVFNNEENCLVEIKHSGKHPGWFDQFMQHHQIQQSSFSKYCWGMAQVIEHISEDNGIAKQYLFSEIENVSTVSGFKEDLCSLAVL